MVTCPSSVRPSTWARFLTAGPICLKLGGHVPWPKRVRRFFHFLILTLHGRDRGRFVKTDFGHFQANGNSQDHQIFTVGTSSETTLHILRVLDLTYISRSQRSKFEISASGGTFRYYLAQDAVTWCADVLRYPVCVRQISVRSDSKYGRQGALVKNILSPFLR